MTRRLASMILTAALLLGAPAQGQDQLANNHDIAVNLHAEEKWSELLSHLDKWESEGGLDPIIFRLRTEALRHTGKIDDAIKTMIELRRGTPESQTARHSEIFRQLGDLYAEKGDFAKASESYRRSIGVSETAIAWRQFALLHSSQDPVRDEAQADNAWRKTLSYGQYINDPQLWQTYAEFRDTLDDPEQTYKAYEHVVRLEPADVNALHRLFTLADELDKKAAQKIIVSRLSRININDPLANAYLGMKAEERGNDRMVKYHYSIVAQAPASETIDKWRARAFLGLAQQAKKRGEAVDYYRMALMADPTLFSAWERAIVTLRRMRRFADARIYADRFFEVRKYLAEGDDLPEDILQGI